MEYRLLGKSGLLVSPLCLGTMTFGSPVEEAEAIRLIHYAMDKGINFIDTANVYEGYTRFMGSAGGVSETILGKAIKDRRDKAVIATKVGSPLGPGPQDVGLTASHILREVDRSLKRLQTDYIDLYILHWPDKRTPAETTLEAINQAYAQGKIRAFGVSNHWASNICEFLWAADKHGWPAVTSSQIPYSLLRREYYNDLLFCERHGIAVTPYQAIQGGLLTGKYRRGQTPPQKTRLADKPGWISWTVNDNLFDQLEAIEQFAKQVGVSMTQYALAWALTQPAIVSPVVGVTRQEQIDEALGALKATIPAEILQKQEEFCPKPWLNLPPFDRV